MGTFIRRGLETITITEQLAAVGCSHHRASGFGRHLIYVTETRERIGLMDAFEAADWVRDLLTAGD